MKVGRPKNIDNPEDLLSLWEQYKQEVDANPDVIEQATPKGDIVSLNVKKPYLKQGFEAFVFRIKGYTIGDYLRGDYEEFSHVVTCIRNEWEVDQISGTLTGRYKAPNLVARLNGLADKQETKLDATIQPITGMEIK
jgi:hypothetical protein